MSRQSQTQRPLKGVERGAHDYPFGRALKSARFAADMTQEVLAAHSGLSETYISQLERGIVPTAPGKDPEPSTDTIRALATACGANASNWIGLVYPNDRTKFDESIQAVDTELAELRALVHKIKNLLEDVPSTPNECHAIVCSRVKPPLTLNNNSHTVLTVNLDATD